MGIFKAALPIGDRQNGISSTYCNTNLLEKAKNQGWRVPLIMSIRHLFSNKNNVFPRVATQQHCGFGPQNGNGDGKFPGM